MFGRFATCQTLTLLVMGTLCNAVNNCSNVPGQDITVLLQNKVNVTSEIEEAKMEVAQNELSHWRVPSYLVGSDVVKQQTFEIGKSDTDWLGLHVLASQRMGPVGTLIFEKWAPAFFTSNADAVVECCYTDSSVMTFYNVADGKQETFEGKERIKVGMKWIMGQLFRPSKPTDWKQGAFNVTEPGGNHPGHVFSLFEAPSVGFKFSSSTLSMDANSKIAQEICIFDYTPPVQSRRWG